MKRELLDNGNIWQKSDGRAAEGKEAMAPCFAACRPVCDLLGKDGEKYPPKLFSPF